MAATVLRCDRRRVPDRCRPQVRGLVGVPFFSRNPTIAPPAASGHPTAPVDGAPHQAVATIDGARAHVDALTTAANGATSAVDALVRRARTGDAAAFEILID